MAASAILFGAVQLDLRSVLREKTCVKHIFLFMAVLGALDVSAASQSNRPNIVLIMADDLGFADIGCYGSEIRTPNLDALAAKGLRFSQFYNTAKCHSSRVSLLTGLYCDQAGGASLSRGATIAEVLGKAGYSTSMVGKWHLSNSQRSLDFSATGGISPARVIFSRGTTRFDTTAKNTTCRRCSMVDRFIPRTRWAILR